MWAVVMQRVYPWIVAYVVREDRPAPPHGNRRMVGQPMRMLTCGLAMGICATGSAELMAQQPSVIDEWARPQNVMMLVGFIFSAGVAWQEIMQGRKRLTALEQHSIKKENLQPAIEALNRQHEQLAEALAHQGAQISQIYDTLLRATRQ